MTSVHGARPFIYKGLHRALKIVAKNFLRYLTSNTWRRFIFLVLLNPSIYEYSQNTLSWLQYGYTKKT